jgi:hypothetical protein
MGVTVNWDFAVFISPVWVLGSVRSAAMPTATNAINSSRVQFFMRWFLASALAGPRTLSAQPVPRTTSRLAWAVRKTDHFRSPPQSVDFCHASALLDLRFASAGEEPSHSCHSILAWSVLRHADLGDGE